MFEGKNEVDVLRLHVLCIVRIPCVPVASLSALRQYILLSQLALYLCSVMVTDDDGDEAEERCECKDRGGR